MTYTIRSTRASGEEDVTLTDSARHAVLLCEALERAFWFTVELENERGSVLWATYTKYMDDRELASKPHMVPNLHDVPGYCADR